MPTLSQLFPLSRLAALRRMPFWSQALGVCAVFAIVGIAVLDDYGLSSDSIHHRQTAADNADYVLGVSEDPPGLHINDRYYGMAFQMPLLLAERALGLQDTRHIYLTRHLVTHLFFIAGGFACGLLVYRMFGSRWIALLAMLLFLLHPRLHAHSFFNSMDIPFAAMLIIALYLTHRAFRMDALGAFLLCGVGVGLAINLRVFGLMLLPMILAMRGLDLWQLGRGERKRIIASVGIFAAAALATVYIIHPYYWENPLRFIEGIRVLSQHPSLVDNLFMGEIYRSDAVPWNYIPVWFAITAPPVALALGALGAAAVCWRAITRPLAALRGRETRFGVLLLGCAVLPVAVVIALQSNIYTGWRQMYFLWGPFCLLAAVGLHTITNINMRGGIWKVGARLPGWVRCIGLRRALAYGVACFGLITTLTAMAALHPNQQVYFNTLTDTKTPGALGNRYVMAYWQTTHRQLLERLLARYDGYLHVWPGRGWILSMLPQEDRDRVILFENPHAADFHLLYRSEGHPLFGKKLRNASFPIHPRIGFQSMPDPPIHAVRAYGGVIASVVAKDVEAYRAAYADVAANGDQLARSAFAIYAYDGALYYLSDDCDPPMSNDDGMRIFLHVTPAALADLPFASREYGFENRDFWLDKRGAFFDGKCIHRQPLPDYPIARIRTGQNGATGAQMKGESIWRADIDLAAHAAHARILAGDYGPPIAQSHFALYMRDNALTYLKSPCTEGDTNARFFLHITPANPADLPAASRELGFANLDFQFPDHGAYAGDICVATLDLPDYPIDRIRTGQFVSGEGRVWSVEFPAAQ